MSRQRWRAGAMVLRVSVEMSGTVQLLPRELMLGGSCGEIHKLIRAKIAPLQSLKSIAESRLLKKLSAISCTEDS